MADRLRTRLAAAALAGVLAATLAGCGGGPSDMPTVAGAPGGYAGAYLDEPYRLAPVTLTDTGGREGDVVEALDRPVTLLFFGYTNCPDICQAVMADLASTVARLDGADAGRVAVWFVTTDPARDDAATLRGYLDRFDRSFEGFTGRLPAVLELARSAHIAVEKGPRLETGGYEVTHGTPVLAVRDDGTVPLLWTEGTSAARIADDVARLLDEEA